MSSQLTGNTYALNITRCFQLARQMCQVILHKNSSVTAFRDVMAVEEDPASRALRRRQKGKVLNGISLLAEECVNCMAYLLNSGAFSTRNDSGIFDSKCVSFTF